MFTLDALEQFQGAGVVSFRFHFGRFWKFLGSSLEVWSFEMQTPSFQAHTKLVYRLILEGWRLDRARFGSLGRSWLGCCRVDGIWLAGWLVGRLVLAAWLSGHRDPRSEKTWSKEDRSEKWKPRLAHNSLAFEIQDWNNASAMIQDRT